MAIFNIKLESGVFLRKSNFVKKLPEETYYYFFADDKAAAVAQAVKLVADSVGHGAANIEFAIFDSIEGFLRRDHSNSHLNSFEPLIEELKDFLGSIVLDSVTVISPQTSESQIVFMLSEGDRKRVVFQRFCFNGDGSVGFGEHCSPVSVQSLVMAVQNAF